jgi:hypothetical protein
MTDFMITIIDDEKCFEKAVEVIFDEVVSEKKELRALSTKYSDCFRD